MFFSFGLIARLEIVTFNFDNDYLVTEKPNVNVLFFSFFIFSSFFFLRCTESFRSRIDRFHFLQIFKF